jgi:hypothetical protein
MKILIALALLLLLVGLTATKSDNDPQGRAVGHDLAPGQTGENPGLDKDDELSSEDADGQPPGLTENGNYGQSHAPGQDDGVGYYYCYPTEYGPCSRYTECCSGTGNCVDEAGQSVCAGGLTENGNGGYLPVRCGELETYDEVCPSASNVCSLESYCNGFECVPCPPL